MNILKEMFPVYSHNCVSRKAVHNWVANISLMTKRLKGGAELAETTVKGLLCCGFRCTGKATGKCINVCGEYVEKQMFFF
jgi:hypothetical protein